MFRALLWPSSGARDYNVDYHLVVSFSKDGGDSVSVILWFLVVYVRFSYHNDTRSNKHQIHNTRYHNQQTLSVVYNTFLKAQPEDGAIETSRNM